MIAHEDIKVGTFTYFTNEESPKEPKQILDVRIQISDETFDYFTNPDLIDFIMQYNFQEEEYGKALTHLCFDN